MKIETFIDLATDAIREEIEGPDRVLEPGISDDDVIAMQVGAGITLLAQRLNLNLGQCFGAGQRILVRLRNDQKDN